MVEIEKMVHKIRLTKDRKDTARETIFKTWENKARFYINKIDIYNLLNAVRKVAASMRYYQAIFKVNQAIIKRLAHYRRDISTSTFSQASDYNKIRITFNRYPTTPIDNNILKQYELAIDSRDLLEKVDIKITDIRRILNTILPETPQGQDRFSLAALFTMPGMGNPQPIMQFIK
jgi:uncharacterized protein (UPF0333 family)